MQNDRSKIGQSENVNAYPQNVCEKFTSHYVEKANQLINISDMTFLMSQTIRNGGQAFVFTDRRQDSTSLGVWRRAIQDVVCFINVSTTPVSNK